MQVQHTDLPTVTVVIPHFRNRDQLERCLESLYTDRAQDVSVLVVDNSGGESGLDELKNRFPGIGIIPLSSNAGYAGGCNEGLRRSCSKYVLFLNDDTEVEPGWSGPLVAAAEADQGIGALQPKILSLSLRRVGKRVFDYAGGAGGLIDRLGYPFCLGRTFASCEEDRGQYDEPRDIFWASGVALFAPRKVLEEMGGFEESFFMHMEEIDLCWRMKLAGYSVRSVPASVVWHEGGASLRAGSPMKIYLNHRNNLTMILRNRHLSALLPVLFARLPLEAVSMIWYLVSGENGSARAWQVLRAVGANLFRLGSTIKGRRKIQGGRKVPDRKLFACAPLSMFFGSRK